MPRRQHKALATKRTCLTDKRTDRQTDRQTLKRRLRREHS